MANIEAMIQWMEDRKGKCTYSMSDRTDDTWADGDGKSFDCSSAVFYSLMAGGFVKKGYPGSTETLFGLNGTLLREISRSEVRRGDIFVAGTPGGSLGSAGHTGIFLNNGSFIHCSYTHNGIAVDTNDAYMSTKLSHHFYRLTTVDTPAVDAGKPTPQMVVLAIDGSWGAATTKRLQEYLNTARDGIISGQIRNTANQSIPSVQFGSGGSGLIRALQKWLGVEVDGNFGPATCRALQKRMGTVLDGVISTTSDCVKEMQRRLNANKL